MRARGLREESDVAEPQGQPPAAMGVSGHEAVDRLLEDYDYPPEVGDILRRILFGLANVAPVSVLLHGSTARGELTWWREVDGRVRLASDIEMYVVGERRFPADVLAAATALSGRIAEEHNTGGAKLFHADIAFVTLRELRQHPPTFRAWDIRESGRTLLGRDVRDELPNLNADTIDLKQLNEVPIHRLWEMVFRLPLPMLTGGANSADQRAFAYVCARQALDLTTWLLPHEQVMVPTFRRRVQQWPALLQSRLGRYFSEISGDLLEECLAGKLSYEFKRPATEIHRDVLDAFQRALRYLLRIDAHGTAAEITQEILDQGKSHWNVGRPLRRLYEAFLLVRDRIFPARPILAARWWLMPKRPHQVAFLLNLNLAAAELVVGKAAADPLDAAEALLQELWYDFEPSAADGAERFRAARRGYVDFLTGTSRWFAPRRKYLLSVIGEEEDPSSPHLAGPASSP